jgi:hypothetical protein
MIDVLEREFHSVLYLVVELSGVLIDIKGSEFYSTLDS